jgi:LysR family transcriptional activator of nhaA
VSWLNYHHLHYFWTVVREGGVAAAARRLRVGAPTVSAQVKALERALGQPLLERRGRALVATETGRLVARYADDIFAAGNELLDAVRGAAPPGPVTLRVGVADVMPKAIAFQLLRPALAAGDEPHVICREGHPDELLAALALHELDLVLSDGPIPPGVEVRAYNHLLGDSGVSWLAAPELARRLRRRFPASLDGEPVLLPGPRTALRRALDRWLDEQQLRPRVVGEFDDGALLKVFGAQGAGVFPAPSVVERQVREQHGVAPVGRLDDVRESFYAISAERRIQHPGVEAVVRQGRDLLKAGRPGGRR